MGHLANLIKREAREVQRIYETEVPTLGDEQLVAKKQSIPKWDPGKHPRDHVGRFIEVGGVVDLPDGGEGRVLGVDENSGKVKVENSDGKVKRLQADEVTMVEGVNEGPDDRPLRPPPDPNVKRAQDKLDIMVAEIKLDYPGAPAIAEAAPEFLRNGGEIPKADGGKYKLSPKDRELLGGDDFNERMHNAPSDDGEAKRRVAEQIADAQTDPARQDPRLYEGGDADRENAVNAGNESGSQEMADLNARQRAEARASEFFEDREPGSVSEEEYQAKVDEFLVEDAGGDVEQPDIEVAAIKQDVKEALEGSADAAEENGQEEAVDELDNIFSMIDDADEQLLQELIESALKWTDDPRLGDALRRLGNPARFR